MVNNKQYVIIYQLYYRTGEARKLLSLALFDYNRHQNRQSNILARWLEEDGGLIWEYIRKYISTSLMFPNQPRFTKSDLKL